MSKEEFRYDPELDSISYQSALNTDNRCLYVVTHLIYRVQFALLEPCQTIVLTASVHYNIGSLCIDRNRTKKRQKCYNQLFSSFSVAVNHCVIGVLTIFSKVTLKMRFLYGSCRMFTLRVQICSHYWLYLFDGRDSLILKQLILQFDSEERSIIDYVITLLDNKTFTTLLILR